MLRLEFSCLDTICQQIKGFNEEKNKFVGDWDCALQKSITLQFIIKSNSLAHHYVTEATLQGSVQLAALIIHMSRISVSL